MKKVRLFILLLIILIIAVGCYIGFKNSNKKEDPPQELSKESLVELANTYLDTYKFTDKRFSSESTEIRNYKDDVDNIEVISIYDSNISVEIDKNTNQFLSFMGDISDNLKECNLSEQEIEKRAWELLGKFANVDDYKLRSLDQFDEEIYMAKFAKKYGEYANMGECINFSFAPQTSELIGFHKKYIPFADNKIILKEEHARKIAMKHIGETTATEINVSLEIVRANNGTGEGKKYRNETRLAYICKFNDRDETEVYVDCTTGEILGMSQLL